MIGMVELLDVAVSVSGVPTFWAAIVPKVITCCTGAAFTVKLCVTGAAAA
jgi:hypothetical protein